MEARPSTNSLVGIEIGTGTGLGAGVGVALSMGVEPDPIIAVELEMRGGGGSSNFGAVLTTQFSGGICGKVKVARTLS